MAEEERGLVSESGFRSCAGCAKIRSYPPLEVEKFKADRCGGSGPDDGKWQWRSAVRRRDWKKSTTPVRLAGLPEDDDRGTVQQCGWFIL